MREDHWRLKNLDNSVIQVNQVNLVILVILVNLMNLVNLVSLMILVRECAGEINWCQENEDLKK